MQLLILPISPRALMSFASNISRRQACTREDLQSISSEMERISYDKKVAKERVCHGR